MEFPKWVEVLLTIMTAVSLTALSVWLIWDILRDAANVQERLEDKRHISEMKALAKWQKMYEEERSARADDNAKLIAEIIELQSENKRLKMIMAKAKVKDIGRNQEP